MMMISILMTTSKFQDK